MARTPLNALQAILIRERLILYFKTKNSEQRIYSVRKLIEDIALSMANEGEARAYQENEDFRDEGRRSASGYTLKNSTVDNLLARRASAISDDNLRLIRNFLLAEGYLPADALSLCGKHPSGRLEPQFRGIAQTDPRLQRYRRALEGEYQDKARTQSLCIAALGRSKPFISLSAVTEPRTSVPPRDSAIAPTAALYEGRLFLLPGDSVFLVEVCASDRKWEACMFRVAAQENSLELLSDMVGSHSFFRAETLAPGSAERAPRLSVRILVDALRARWQLCRERHRTALGRLARMFDPRNADTPPAVLTDKDAELIEAAKSGQAYRIFQLLADGSNINAVDPETRRTAAHFAAAGNSLAAVFALTCRQWDEEWVLRDYLPEIDPHGEVVKRWRVALLARYPLITDSEGCFASALALASTDDSERNRSATTIWNYLMLTEAEYVAVRYEIPRHALLEVWKPSSVMMDAMQRYAAPLPDGFTAPKPD